MELPEFVGQVDNFEGLAPREKIRLFAWWLHAHKGVGLFSNNDIRDCYKLLHLLPDQIAKYLGRMVSNGDLMKERGAFKLGRAVRIQLDAKYGVHQTVAQVDKILTELPAKVPNLAERTFLDEALKCYRVQAFRACVVMTWNLAYNHLLNWLLADSVRLTKFNAAIAKRNSKKAALVISKYDDFEDLKEREVIDICNISNLFNSSVYKILVAKLDRRNISAHPSSVVIVQAQADDVVTDLINNVVLTLV